MLRASRGVIALRMRSIESQRRVGGRAMRGFPQWYQLEFEKVLFLTGMKFDWESKNNAYLAKIEGSMDGKKWSQLADLTN
jgi:hypothetical protein